MIAKATPLIDLETEVEGVRERLRQLREESQYPTFRTWAQHLNDLTGLGVTGSTIRRYEMGLLRMPMEYPFAVARVTGTSLDWIFRGAGERLYARPKDDPERVALALQQAAKEILLRAGVSS